MTAVLIGIIFMGLGIMGLIRWFGDFLFIVRGLGPISLFLGGLVAVISGASALKSRRQDDKPKN